MSEDRVHPVLFAGEEAAEGTGEPAPAKGAGVLWKYLMKFLKTRYLEPEVVPLSFYVVAFAVAFFFAVAAEVSCAEYVLEKNLGFGGELSVRHERQFLCW